VIKERPEDPLSAIAKLLL
jgi:hypothetical protein